MRRVLPFVCFTLVALFLVVSPDPLPGSPQKRPPRKKDDDDDDRNRPPQRKPLVDRQILKPVEEDGWLITRERITTIEFEWNARAKKWVPSKPDVDVKVVDRVRIRKKEVPPVKVPDGEPGKKPPMPDPKPPVGRGDKQPEPKAPLSKAERRKQWLDDNLARYQLATPTAPQRLELDARLIRALAQPVGKPPSPFTERIFVRREKRVGDGAVVDTYRIVTYTHRHNGQAWAPQVAKHDLIQIPVREGDQALDLQQAQDQAFLGEFREREVEGEVELPARALEQPPADANQPLFRMKYVLLENRGKNAVDVFYHPASQVQGVDRFDPPTTAPPLEIRLLPGDVVVLFNGDRRLMASKLRIWARDAAGKKWTAHQHRDYNLIPEDPRNGRAYRSPRMLLGKVEIAID